ncbi:hypothetical protein P4O66_008153, partial [Electrophorus voltai]
VASLFKPSSKADQGESLSTHSAPQTAGLPLTYAEFIVKSKTRGALEGAHGERSADPPQTVVRHSGVGGPTCETIPKRPAVLRTPQAEAGEKDGPTPVSERQEEDEGQSTEACSSTAHLLGSGNGIIVSPRQRGNPILKFVRSVPWEFGEVVPDYVLGRTTCALFLSLRYHNLNPNYIHDRLKRLGQAFTLRVLLVQVDVKDPHHALKELARICIIADCTLILAWSPEEAGRYLETYKSYEKKPADLLKEQVEKDYLSKVTDCLTTVKSINKTDAITLLSTFSSLEGIINASKEELVLCPGLGPQK